MEVSDWFVLKSYNCKDFCKLTCSLFFPIVFSYFSVYIIAHFFVVFRFVAHLIRKLVLFTNVDEVNGEVLGNNGVYHTNHYWNLVVAIQMWGWHYYQYIFLFFNIYFGLELSITFSSRSAQLAIFLLDCDNYVHQSIVLKDIPSLTLSLVG